MEMELDLEQALRRAMEWARGAGEIHLAYFRGKDLDIRTKSSVYDVVTRADKESEAFLVAKIGECYPGHAILGEETGEHAGKAHETATGEKPGTGEYRWVVDPLDGTNNFSQGLPIWTVSIGLQRDGETLLGVVYAPYFNEMFTAIRGQGAYLDGKRLQVSAKQDLAHSVMGTGFPYDKGTNPDNNIPNLVVILPFLRGIRRMGTAAYDLACTAAGWLDGYWELNLNLWDVCAGILLVEEAGGIVVPLRTDRGISIIAGNCMLVDKIREKVR